MSKNIKLKEEKQKTKILVVAIIALLGVIGGTLAYFTTSANSGNIFKTGIYQNRLVERFVSPTNWQPGQTAEKDLSVTNTGSIAMALRASITQEWTNAKGQKMSLTDGNGNVAAIINFNEGWTLADDGYYYYGSKTNMTMLRPDETSTSFISGVTFNRDIEADLNENTSDNGQVITFTSTGNGYDNASYSLTIKIDTIQYDQAQNIWGN